MRSFKYLPLFFCLIIPACSTLSGSGSSSVEAPAVVPSTVDLDETPLVALPSQDSLVESEVPVEVIPETELTQTEADLTPIEAALAPHAEVEPQAPPEPLYDFPVETNSKVDYFIDYYTGRARRTFKLWMERSGRYLPMMREIFAEEGLPKDLAYLSMVESGFNPKAYSWAHAVGPWQFIESTGRRYGLHNDWWHDERRDPEKATRAAASFLSDLYDQFDGDWYLAVASYNAGPGTLRRAIRKDKTRDFWKISRGSVLKNETKNYVPKLLAVLTIAKNLEKYGFEDLNYHQPLEYDTAALASSTDLEVIARLSGTDYETIKGLNPELKRWATPPHGQDYQLRLPAGSAENFQRAYAELPKAKRANFVRHKVKSGDTLLAMSKRYGVRVSDIKRLNKIRNAHTLQIGDNLIVPLNPDSSTGNPLAELKDDYKRSRRTYYKVRSGDSLWKISQKFDVTEKQLRVWNRLGWSNVIRPGQRLVVSAKGAAPSKKKAKRKYTGPQKQVVYKVKSGDTLWDIGRDFDVNAGQIRNWNNLAENHIIKPGDRLTLHLGGEQRG